MRVDGLPLFVVREVLGGGERFVGEVSRWVWVGEGHVGYVYLGEGRFVGGRFMDVDEGRRRASFVVEPVSRKREASDSFVPGDVAAGMALPYLDGYWGERAVLALDRGLVWRERVFRNRDAVWHGDDGRTEVLPGGWDHEHCRICWAKISESENSVFVENSQGRCVCPACYREYVEGRSLGFIEKGS